MRPNELIEKVQRQVGFNTLFAAGEVNTAWERVADALAGDLARTMNKLDLADKTINRQNESIEMFLEYMKEKGITGEDIRLWDEQRTKTES